MSYKEPAPIHDKENPLESMMSRFDFAAQILGLDSETYNVLKNPARQIIVSLPVTMDDGRVKVFEGFRVIHSTILGPSKGGIRYDMGVNLDEVRALAAWMTSPSKISNTIPCSGSISEAHCRFSTFFLRSFHRPVLGLG